MFSNIFIAELEYFSGNSPPGYQKSNLCPDTKIKHRLNFSCSPHFSCASLLVDATLSSRPTPRIPQASPFLFLLFPLFPILSFSFSLFFFLLLSSFFSLLLSAHACPSPVPCAALQHTPVPCPRAAGCSAHRSASARAIPSLVLLPQSTLEGCFTMGRVVLPSVEAVDALCGGRRAQCTAEIFLPCEPPLLPINRAESRRRAPLNSQSLPLQHTARPNSSSSSSQRTEHRRSPSAARPQLD